MMLVHHHAVEAELLGCNELTQIAAVELAPAHRVVIRVGQRDPCRFVLLSGSPVARPDTATA